MVLPLLPLVLIATGAATGSGGVVAGLRGGLKMRQARHAEAEAVAEHERERQESMIAAASTNDLMGAYGLEQEEALRDVVVRMADFIQRNSRQVKASLKMLVHGVDVEVNPMTSPSAFRLAGSGLLRGLVTSGTTGMGTAAGTTSLVYAFGTASTGTAISTLSGAAAESATLAALGGGSLAAGGGGMALGATALNVVTVGPALLVGGLVFNSQGEKAKTQAARFVGEAKIATAEVVAMRAVFEAVDTRVSELSRVLEQLKMRASDAIYVLEGIEGLEEGGFQAHLHSEEFQRAIALTVAVRDLCATPVVDNEGAINPMTGRLIVKYREFTDDAE